MSFSKEIQDFERKVSRRASIVFRVSALNIFSDIIVTSIVGNPDVWKSKAPKGYVGGRYRYNWQATIGNPSIGELDGTDKDGSKATARAADYANRAKLGQRLYLVNNLPYAQGIEDGTASTRGTGNVKVAISKWKPVVKEVMARFK